VIAAHDWDEPAERRRVQPSLPGSWEELDIVIHIDSTRGVHPLDPLESEEHTPEAELPETYPTGV